MKPHPSHPPERQIQQRMPKDFKGLSELRHQVESISPTSSFSVGLQERLFDHLPDTPLPVSGSWTGRPPRDSADSVLWRVAALLKHDPESSSCPLEDFRPLVVKIAAYLNIDDDDGWRLFVKSHAKAKMGPGALSDRLQAAKFNAQEDIDRGTDRYYMGTRPIYRDSRRRLLVGIFWHILRDGKPGERFLSPRNAGTLIGVDGTTAWTWIRSMVDVYLTEIKPAKGFRTARYRWIDC